MYCIGYYLRRSNFFFNFLVNYNLDDLVTMVHYIKESKELTDQSKAEFITFSISVMKQLLYSIFHNKSDTRNQLIRKEWFINEQASKHREYLLLGFDDAGSAILFCAYCVAYSSRNYALCKDGLRISSNEHVYRTIKRHDSTNYHKDAVEKYQQQQAIKSKGDKDTDPITKNRYIVKKLIEAVLFIATSGNLKRRKNKLQNKS